MSNTSNPISRTYTRRQAVAGMAGAVAALALASRVSPARADAPSQITDGTYTAAAPGLYGDVTVSVTIEDGKIAAAEVLDSIETTGIGNNLYDKNDVLVTSIGGAPVRLIPEYAVANNSLAIDIVTGATVSSFAVLAALADCIEQAGGSPEDFAGPVEYPVYGDTTADVVIVGGGGAGLASAVRSLEQGKSVVIIEKNGACGGDTLVCGAIYNCPDPELQSRVEMTEPVKTTIENALALTTDDPEKQAALEAMQAPVREQWEEYKASGRTDLFDSQEWMALQTWINGDMVAKPELVERFAFSSYDTLQWFEGLGMEFKDQINQGTGALWQRTHTSVMKKGTGMISTYADQIANYGDQITVMTETTAKELVRDDDGRVVGVVASDNHTGNIFTVTANDGVVMSTGGFSANNEMVQKYNTSGKWPDLTGVITSNRSTCSQGEGIDMATAIGASLTDMDQIQMLYFGNYTAGVGTDKYSQRYANGVDQIIMVNQNGERFVREDGRRDEICLAVLKQPGAMFYFIDCSDGSLYVDIDSPEWKSSEGLSFKYLEDGGFIYRGDTLEELAEKIGIDPVALQATVDKFNESVETGEDEFGRTLFSTKLEHGPWTACPRCTDIHHTMGGLTIDTETHVIDTDGNIIPGLMAAGEVTGGIHGGNRLGGNAVADTVIFGKISSETIVSEA